MEQSGAKLMDVGTTNKTKPSDYLNAYEEGETGALYEGPHQQLQDTRASPRRWNFLRWWSWVKKLNLPVIYDMGSGLMADLTDCGVDEPTVLNALRTGIDVILFSGTSFWEGLRAVSSQERKSSLIR